MMDYDSKQLIDDIIKEAGWKTNYAFPVASKENAYLINLLIDVKIKCKVLDDEIEQYRSKNDKLKTHLSMVKQEQSITESLLAQRQKEIDAKKHEICLIERETGQLKLFLSNIAKQRKEIANRTDHFENLIFAKNNELNTIKSKMLIDDQLIESYLSECENNVKVRERLQYIQKKDDSKLAALNSEANKLSSKCCEAQKKLDVAVMKTNLINHKVDAASERCREENEARRELLRIWESCVKQMAKRDEDFVELNKQYNEMLTNVGQSKAKVEELKKMLHNVIDDIKSVELASEETNKEITSTREQLLKTVDNTSLLESDLETLQKTLERTERDYRIKLAETKQLKISTEENNKRLQKLLDDIKNSESRLNEITDKRITAERLAKIADENLQNQEKCKKEALNYHEKLKVLMFKTNEDLHAIKNEGIILESHVSGARNTLRGLDKKTRERETDLIKLDELIYKAVLFAQRLEQKIDTIERDPLAAQEEANSKEEIIRRLRNELDERNRSCHTLTTMIRQFQNEKRICQMKCDKIQSQLNTVENLLNTTHLTVKNTLIALKKVEAEKQELLVTLNLNKFQVRRMDNKLKMLRDSIMNSETRQLQMDALEREVEAEINMRKTNLLSELHLLKVNLEEIRKDFNKRQARLCHVKSRYEVTLITMDKNAENEIDTRMRYILEALSQRQELRQKGDELDIVVRTAEEELRALENTVLVMNSLNEMARIALPKNVPEESMIEEEVKLKELLKQAETQWQQIREERRKRRAAIMNLELQRQETNESLNLSTERVRSASAYIEKVLKSLSDIQEKNKRSKKRYHKAIQSLGKPTPEIRLDVDVRLWRDYNRAILLLYERCLRNSSEINDEILNFERSITESLNFPRESIKGHRSTISRNEENGSETDRSRKSSHSESLSLPITNIGESFDLHQSPDTNKSSIRQTSSRSFRTDSNYDTFSSHGSSDILPEKDK